MQQNVLDLASLESLRESGAYDRIAALLPDGWQALPEFEDEALRLRLLVAEISGRCGRVEDMEMALAPYIEDLDRVPLGRAARVILMIAIYRYRRHECPTNPTPQSQALDLFQGES